MDKTKVKQWLILSGILATGAMVRLGYLWRVGWVIDSDEAITGLMGRHILQGIRRPIFFYGQDYLGSLEAWLDAIIFYLFGSSIVTLRVVPIIFGILVILTTFMLAGMLYGRRAAFFAAMLAAVPPAFVVMYQTKAWMGHMEMVVFGNLALWQTARIIKEDKRLFRWLALGLTYGFGFWISLLMVVFIVVSALILVIYRVVRVRTTAAAVFGTIVGAAPFIAYNIRHMGASADVGGLAGMSDILDHVSNLLFIGMPILLGAHANRGTTDLWPMAAIMTYLLLLSSLYVVVRIRKNGCSEEIGKTFILGLIIVNSLLFVFSRFGFFALEPRYLIPMVSAFTVAHAGAIDWLWGKKKTVGLIALFVIMIVNIVSLAMVNTDDARFIIAGEPTETSHDEIIAVLDSHDIHYVRANYWIAYRLTFETNERIIGVPEVEGAPSQDRFARYTQDVAGADRVAVILMSSQRHLANRYGVNGRERVSVGNYDVYLP